MALIYLKSFRNIRYIKVSPLLLKIKNALSIEIKPGINLRSKFIYHLAGIKLPINNIGKSNKSRLIPMQYEQGIVSISLAKDLKERVPTAVVLDSSENIE